MTSLPPQAAQATPSDDTVRRALEDILSSSEYDTGIPKATTPGFSAWLLEKLRDLWLDLANLHSSSPGLFWLILIACIVVLAAIFLHAAVIMSRALRASRESRPGRSLSPSARREDPFDLLRRAREAAGRGDAVEALRLSHRAALLGLDRRGLVRFHDSLTNGDVARQLRPHPRERESFAAFARVYEPAFFGRVNPAAPDVDASLDLAASLAQEARA